MPYNKPYDSTYITNNYDLFVFKGGNRDITRNERHIQALQQQLKHNQLKSIPIVVTRAGSKLCIIDGQNRFEAMKREKLDIVYTIEKAKVTIQNIRDLNTLHKPWNQRDIVDSYVHTERERFGDACHTKPYHMYKHFMTKHRITSNVALFLLTGANTKSNKIRFRTGRLSIPDWNKSCDKINFLKSMQYLIGVNHKRSYFVTAMMAAYDDYRFRKKRWMRKLELNSRKIVIATNSLDYMDMINEVYNFKETDKVFFELKDGGKAAKAALKGGRPNLFQLN